MNNDEEHPLSKKTPNGGKIIATMILMISEHVNGILIVKCT